MAQQSLLRIRESGEDSYLYMADAYEASIFKRLSDAVEIKKSYRNTRITEAFAGLGHEDMRFALNDNSQAALREQFDKPFDELGVEHKIFINVDTGEVTISYNPSFAPGLEDTTIGIDAGITRLQAVISACLKDAKTKNSTMKSYQTYFVTGIRNFRKDTGDIPYALKRKYVVQIVAAAMARSKAQIDMLKTNGIMPNFGNSQAFAKLMKENNFTAAAFLIRNGGDFEQIREDLGEEIVNTPFMRKLEMYYNDLRREKENYWSIPEALSDKEGGDGAT